MTRCIRAAGSLFALMLLAGYAPAAEQKDVDAAIQKGTEFLKSTFRNGASTAIGGGGGGHGIGPGALAGIALIEAKVPANDPALTAIANSVRAESYTQFKTYQISLCLIFLDRLEDPADVPLIQMLAVRLMAGQNAAGGWTYKCISEVSGEEVQWLKARMKTDQLVAGKGADTPPKDPKPDSKTPAFHPDLKEYAAALANRRPNTNNGPAELDDNSNTQFAIVAIWAARKHGAPVEASLDLIEKRFLASQDPATGAWFYNDLGFRSKMYRASMTCAGLIGLSTGVARRVKPEATKEPAPKAGKSDNPFFSPSSKPEDKKNEKKPAWQTPAIQRGFNALGTQFNVLIRGGDSPEHPYYTYWSIERVGVLYGVEKIGGVDWYETLANMLVKAQAQNGSWNGGGSGGPDIDTSFAVLILCRANLTRDLSNKFGGKDNELRAGTSGAAPGGTGVAPMPKTPGTGSVPGTPALPSPTESEASKLATQLLLAPATDWTRLLENLRDSKGADNTKGLVIAIRKLDGDRKKEARQALADRLTRMSADTLKAMMKDDDAELRRGAALAGAMKDDKTHIPDLIDRLLDDEDAVVRAAKAGLKSLTSQDFGPKVGANKDECKAAAAAWRAWWAKQK